MTVMHEVPKRPEANRTLDIEPAKFAHVEFTEASRPDLADVAQRMHASDYCKRGFVTEDAIGPDGKLAPEIDKARGDNVVYRLSKDTATGAYVSTLRRIRVPQGGTFKDLPAYKISQPHLYEREHAGLEELGRRGYEFEEVGALGATSPLAVFESFRDIIQDGIGKNRGIIFTVVTDTHRALVSSFGRDNLITIGDDIRIGQADARVGNKIALRPTLLLPDVFMDNLLKSYEAAEPGSRQSLSLQRNFLFYTDGLAEEQMSPEVARKRRELIAETRLGPFLVQNAAKPVEWERPREFDLNADADRMALYDLLQTGAVKNIVDKTTEIADELFEIRHTDKMRDNAAREKFIAEVQARAERNGEWFFFPWNGELHHYPDAGDYWDVRTSRHQNLVTQAEQRSERDRRILIAGLSTGRVALNSLVQGGIGGEYIIADPDVQSLSNNSRTGGTYGDVGQSKVDLAAKYVSEFDPHVGVLPMRAGITPESLRMLEQSGELPQVIIEQVDDLQTKILIREFAKKNKIAVLTFTDVGEVALLDIERHDVDPKAKPFGGRLPRKLYDRLLNGTATDSEKGLGMLAIVGWHNASPRMLSSFLEAGKTLPGIAQLGRTTQRGAALAAKATEEILLGRKVASRRRKDSTSDVIGLPKLDTSLKDAARTYSKFLPKYLVARILYNFDWFRNKVINAPKNVQT